MTDREFNLKLVDLSFDAVKFLMMLFVSVFTFYLTIISVAAAILTSSGVASNVEAIFKIAGLLFSVLVTGFMWATVYLVIRASNELLARLQEECPEAERPRFERAHVKLVWVGIIGGLSGTALILVISFFFLSI